jgi:hypothetical protein
MHETLRRTRLDYFSADTVSVTLGYAVCIIVELHIWRLTLLFLTQCGAGEGSVGPII